MNIMVNNRSYISPGNTLLPRKMTQIEERARKREEEKEKRKQLLEECERNPLVDEERVTRTNATENRDEVMVFDDDGNAQRLRVSLKKK